MQIRRTITIVIVPEQWQHALVRQYAQCRAAEHGMRVAEVDPAYTSKTCSRCGVLGQRKRHRFSCAACGFTAHADVNAAKNIRNRFIVLRHDGLRSISPEALGSPEGKPLAELAVIDVCFNIPYKYQPLNGDWMAEQLRRQ